MVCLIHIKCFFLGPNIVFPDCLQISLRIVNTKKSAKKSAIYWFELAPL